jgi:hypothetical protein
MFDSLVSQETLVNAFTNDEMTGSIVNEALFEASVELNDVYQEFNAIDQLADTLDDLEHLHAIIEQHGVTESLLAFTNRDRLLSTAMPAFDACEALGAEGAVLGSTEAVAAQEAILEKIKDVAASWFKRAWDAVVSLGKKVVELSKVAYEKVVDATKWVAGKVYNAAKAAKEVITAHPIAAALGAVALAVGVGAVIMSIWEIPMPVSAETLISWKNTVGSKLSSGMKGTVRIGRKGIEYAGSGLDAVKKGTGTALGYTKEKFTALADGAKAAFAEGGSMHRMGGSIAEYAKKALDHAKSGASAAGKYAMQAIRFLMNTSMDLVRFVSGKALAVITGAFKAFKGLFGSKEEIEHYVSDATMNHSLAAAAAARAAASHSG